MDKTIRLKAGESTQIINRNFSSIPMEYMFTATAVTGGDPFGEIEIRGSNWIFPKQPQTRPLQRQNSVKAGYWDTFFRVTVTADTDLELSLPQRALGLGAALMAGMIGGLVPALRAVRMPLVDALGGKA